MFDSNISTDEYGAQYSADGLYLLCGPTSDINEYSVKEGVKVICDSAFRRKKYDRIILPASTECLGRCGIKCGEITIPENVSTISHSAFTSVNKIKSNSRWFCVESDCLIDLYKNTIMYVIDNDTKSQLIIPSSVEKIEAFAIPRGRKYSLIEFPENLNEIARGAICCEVDTIVFKGAPKIFSAESFYDENNVKNIIIPKGSINYFSLKLTIYGHTEIDKYHFVKVLTESSCFSSTIDYDLIAQKEKQLTIERKKSIDSCFQDAGSLSSYFKAHSSLEDSHLEKPTPDDIRDAWNEFIAEKEAKKKQKGPLADSVVSKYFDIVNDKHYPPRDEITINYSLRKEFGTPRKITYYGPLMFPLEKINGESLYVARWAKTGERLLEDSFFKFHYEGMYSKVFDGLLDNIEFLEMLQRHKNSHLFETRYDNQYSINMVIRKIMNFT